MKPWYKSSLFHFVLTLILALGVILFLGREFDPQTNKSSLSFSSQGWKQFRKGMDVAGGVKLTYKVDFLKYDQLYKDATEREAAKKRAVAIILKNIDKRVSSLGVSDYVARQQLIDGNNFIVIEIGGIYSLDAAKAIIGKTVELEFKVPSDLADSKSELTAERASFVRDVFSQIKIAPEKIEQIVLGREAEEVYAQAYSGADIDLLPLVYQNNRAQLLSAKPGAILDFGLGDYATSEQATLTGSQTTTVRGYTLLIVDKIERIKNTATSGDYISGALSKDFKAETTLISAKEVFVRENLTWAVAIDPSTKEILNGAFFSYASTSVGQTGKPVVTINFDDKGKKIFCNLTKVYAGKQMAIFVGGELLTAPTINEPICEGQAQIDGQFTAVTARELAEGLNEGALPAPLILSYEEKVSALLGDSAMQGAIAAAVISLILILVLLLVMYERKLALLGFFVLISYAIYVLAFFKLIDYAFSLSGIAAMILSLGMGIDANILMFERLKEEVKSGRSWLSAVETAHERSRRAIFDGNITTILIFIVLFVMSTSIFKGFGFAGIITGGLILLIIVPLTKLLLTLIKK